MIEDYKVCPNCNSADTDWTEDAGVSAVRDNVMHVHACRHCKACSETYIAHVCAWMMDFHTAKGEE